jgi:hypothetical protein
MRCFVVKLNEQRFRLGPSMICEDSDLGALSSTLCSWQDNGKTFSLRHVTEHDRNMPPSSSKANMALEMSTSSGIWLFGKDNFCRVGAWCEGLESEEDTINFVKTHCPNIPLPEVIYSWVDRDWDRVILFMKRLPGKTLDESWPSLSPSQRSKIAQDIAGYCAELSKITSPRFETATKRGVWDDHMNERATPGHPSWKPRSLGPFCSMTSPNTCVRNQTRIPRCRFRRSETLSIFTTLCLHQSGSWSHRTARSRVFWVGEMPLSILGFWFTLKVGICAGFLLDPATVGSDKKEERVAWCYLLQDALISEGFPSWEGPTKWWKARRT